MTLPDFITHFPNNTDSPEVTAKFGAIGDYIGGYWGTLISLIGTAITIFFVYRTFSLTRKTEDRSRIFSIFSEMTKTHDSIVESLTYSNCIGRDVFKIFLSEFNYAYKIVSKISSTKAMPWDLHSKIDIAYTFMLLGPTWLARAELSNYDDSSIGLISNEIARTRDKSTENRQTSLRGHQSRLSNYYRNLYGIYSFIDSSNIDKRDKQILAKVVRTKLSNHEQGLLAMNSISHLGRAWSESGLLSKYDVIKNIPKMFFTLDKPTSIDTLFPEISFEWQSTIKKLSTKEIKLWKRRIFIQIFKDA